MIQTESYPRDAFKSWQAVTQHPYVVGDFVWSAIDYLGESGIGRTYYEGETPGEHWEGSHFPWHGAHCGVIDITGFRKPISYYREVLFNPQAHTYMSVREPDGLNGTIHETKWSTWPSLASWTWPGWEGKNLTVDVYSRCPKVQLLLDKKLIGERECGEDNAFMATFDVRYYEGSLIAVGMDDNDQPVDTFKITSAGDANSVRLSADVQTLKCGQQDLCYVLAEIVDRDGNLCSVNTNPVRFSVSGPAEIVATFSADMKDQVSYSETVRDCYQGRAMVVVKALDQVGDVTVRATSNFGIKSDEIQISVR